MVQVSSKLDAIAYVFALLLLEGRSAETITKWGLRGFLLLVHTCLHPGVPATKCRAQIVV
jgi:hypothetical protein